MTDVSPVTSGSSTGKTVTKSSFGNCFGFADTIAPLDKSEILRIMVDIESPVESAPLEVSLRVIFTKPEPMQKFGPWEVKDFDSLRISAAEVIKPVIQANLLRQLRFTHDSRNEFTTEGIMDFFTSITEHVAKENPDQLTDKVDELFSQERVDKIIAICIPEPRKH